MMPTVQSRMRQLPKILLAILCLVPATRVSADFDVAVQILAAPWGGTVSAAIAQASSPGLGSDRVGLIVAVCDARGTAAGWEVQLGERLGPDGDWSGQQLAIRRPFGTVRVLAGQPLTPVLGPGTFRIARGQLLTTPVPVIRAMRGSGAGVYAFAGVVGTDDWQPVGARALVIVLVSAP